jgi:hypothetical protein
MAAPPRTFHKTVSVHKRDDNYNLVLADEGEKKDPIVLRTLGDFVFRVPTIAQQRDIGIRRARQMNGVDSYATLDLRTYLLVEALSVVPYQIEKAPDGWDWDARYDFDEMFEIFDAYTQGMKEIREGNGSQGTLPPAA